jgi:hypothetical protein
MAVTLFVAPPAPASVLSQSKTLGGVRFFTLAQDRLKNDVYRPWRGENRGPLVSLCGGYGQTSRGMGGRAGFCATTRGEKNYAASLREKLESFRRTAINASEQIDEFIAGLTDWRGEMLADLRRIIREADPEIVEEWKWMGAPVFSDQGVVCVANAFKDKVKLTFDEGASLPDPDTLFNNGLGGKKWRAIDLHEGDEVNESSLKVLVRAGVDFNRAKAKPAAKKKAAK